LGDIFSEQDFKYLQQISQVVKGAEPGEWSIGSMVVIIRKLDPIENNLIKIGDVNDL